MGEGEKQIRKLRKRRMDERRVGDAVARVSGLSAGRRPSSLS
jgi:hypothetical protein